MRDKPKMDLNDAGSSELRQRHEKIVARKIHEACPGFTSLPEYETSRELLSSGVRLLKTLLVEACSDQDVDTKVMVQLAQSLARLHLATHCSLNANEEFSQLRSTVSTAVEAETCESMFVQPYVQHEPDEEEVMANAYKIHTNQTILDAVDTLKNTFQTKQECLLHGNLNTAAVAVVAGQPKLVHLSSGCLGPPSYDLGVLLAHYMLCYYQHLLTPEDNDTQRKVAYKMLDVCDSTVKSYLETLDLHKNDKDRRQKFEEELISETAGFAGCEFIRSVLGPERPAELQTQPDAQQEVLQAGIRLITAFQRITNAGQLVNIALMLTY